MNTMIDLFRFAATRHGTRTAVEERHTGRTRSAAELITNASRLAAQLGHLGMRKGERGVVMLSNRVEFIEAEIALAQAGLIKVALPGRLESADAAAQLAFLEPSVLVIEAGELERLRGVVSEVRSLQFVVVLDGDETPTTAPVAVASYDDMLDTTDECTVTVAPADAYGLRFTSGTTDRPKAVLHSHAGFAAIVRNQLLNVNWGDYLGPDDRFLQFLPLSAGTIFWVYSCLVSGAKTIIDTGFDPVGTLTAIKSTGTTCTFMVPPMINAMVQATDGTNQDTALRAVFMGGEAMPAAQLRAATAAFGPVFLHYYAASEYPVCTITNRLDAPPPDASSCGQPALGTEIALVDEEDVDVHRGATGNLLIRGDHVFKEYWKNPEATAATKAAGGWVRTGDMARQEADGYTYLVERKQDVIGSRDHQVVPQDVEEVLAAIPGIGEAVVLGASGNGADTYPIAVIVPTQDNRLNSDKVIAAARGRLEPHQVPVYVYILSDPLPRSPLGKVIRRQVRELIVEPESDMS